MVGLDTNVLVRVLVGDDPVQTRLAEDAFVHHCRQGGVFVSLVVLAEVAWVLSSGYRWDRSTISKRLGQLLRTRGVAVETPELVHRALEKTAVGRAGLADLLILGRAESHGALPLLTFDEKLAREDGVELLSGEPG